MKAQLLFLMILAGYSNSWAQDSTIVTIKAGSSIRDVLTVNDIFLYPQFVNGKVLFRNGVVAGAKMNYNSLTDQMLFIDPKNDTLALADEKNIHFIAIDKDTFFYADGYIRQVAGNSIVKVAEKKIWEIADIQKMGSHNRPAITYAVTPMNKITDAFGRTYDLVLTENVVLRKKARYYFGDEYNHFIIASKKNLIALFPKQENILINYLKDNKVHFDSKSDLEKLVQFLEHND